MGNMDNLIGVTELAAFRAITGQKCATEQGIRSQIRALEAGEKTEKEVGFKIVRVTKTVVLLRLIDPELEKSRKEIVDFAEKNSKKKLH